MNDWKKWYEALDKPSITPSPAFIGTIWTILYPIIIFSYCAVAYKTYKKELPKSILAVFTINMIANLAFTPIQFGLRNLGLASLDIFIIWITILALIIMLWSHSKTLALLQIPYLAWVTVASYLQYSITILNR